MTDRIRTAFLSRQLDEGLALASQSDLLDLVPLGRPADRFLAVFSCRGLVRHAEGRIEEADHFEVGISFPPDYLRAADPLRTVTWLGPANVWHPNIAFGIPLICLGHLLPGTDLVDILYQTFEIITWNKVTMREDDALNHAACQWARNNPTRYPVDRRPLKRRALELRTIDRQEGAADGLA